MSKIAKITLDSDYFVIYCLRMVFKDMLLFAYWKPLPWAGKPPVILCWPTHVFCNHCILCYAAKSGKKVRQAYEKEVLCFMYGSSYGNVICADGICICTGVCG